MAKASKKSAKSSFKTKPAKKNRPGQAKKKNFKRFAGKNRHYHGAKAGIKKPSPAKPRVKEIPSEENLKKLLHKGRSRGFLTEEEILYTFPEVEEYLFLYE
ncbi:MAG: hypothetical protein V1692_02855, partial [bacterium]